MNTLTILRIEKKGEAKKDNRKGRRNKGEKRSVAYLFPSLPATVFCLILQYIVQNGCITILSGCPAKSYTTLIKRGDRQRMGSARFHS